MSKRKFPFGSLFVPILLGLALTMAGKMTRRSRVLRHNLEGKSFKKIDEYVEAPVHRFNIPGSVVYSQVHKLCCERA